MKNKTVGVVIIVIIFALIAGVALSKTGLTMPQKIACTAEAKICPDGSAVGRVGPNCDFAACPAVTYSWTFTEKGDDKATGGPLTGVTLTTGGKTYDAGTHLGSCNEIDGTTWKLLDGEQSGVMCWFAGGGDELGVFVENGSPVLKQGTADEGSEEVAGTRGGFKTLLTIGR